MAEVHSINGGKVETPDAQALAIGVLEGTIAEIKSGEMFPEQLMVIITATGEDRAKVYHTTRDTGLNIAESVHLLEVTKFDIIEMSKRP